MGMSIQHILFVFVNRGQFSHSSWKKLRKNIFQGQVGIISEKLNPQLLSAYCPNIFTVVSSHVAFIISNSKSIVNFQTRGL